MIKENLIELFQNSVRNNWELPAFSDYNTSNTLTFGQVGTQIARLHILFEKAGIQRGDKIALIGKNSASWCTTYIATMTYGGVIVPILHDFTPTDAQNIINHSDSKLLFVANDIFSNLKMNELEQIQAAFSLSDFSILYAKEGSTIEQINANLDTLFNEKYPNGYTSKDVEYAKVDNSELVCISYTSGSTGRSKGVMLPANAFAGNIAFGITTNLLPRGERTLSFLPLAHAYGCAFDFLTAFCCGTHATFLGKIPSPAILIKAFAEVKPACIFSVPLIIEKVYNKQLKPIIEKPVMKVLLSIPLINKLLYRKIRNKITHAFGDKFEQVIIGGAALNAEAEAFFKKIGFRFTVGYGMTECAPLISYTHWKEFKPHSIGKVLDVMEAKILSDDPEHIPGEILVRGENVMMGYYKNEEATREAFTEDGWMHTGDMGTMDPDGTLYIKGRNKSMLLGPNGQNIYPEELEDLINNAPYIVESLVVQNKENKLVALVVIDNDACKADGVDDEKLAAILEETRRKINKSTAAYENIAEFRIHPTEFEKTPKKSIKRFLYTNILK